MKRFVATMLASTALFAAAAGTAPAEVFVLRGGGQVVGELVNPKESPRRQYVVQTADGAAITLDAAQVEKVQAVRPAEAEYERIYPAYADTAAAQWELAQWCRQNKLAAQRERHLRRVIELDPDHADARHALGYSLVDRQWVTRDEAMIQRGYQKYKGEWRLKQEIELLESKEKQAAAQQEWFQNIKRWRGWLGTDRDRQARENLRTIADPAAVKALTAGLQEDPNPAVRVLLVESLAKIDAPDAVQALAVASLADEVAEVRLTCLDHLQTKPRPEAVRYYIGRLSRKKSTNEEINRAAFALGRMKDPSAIEPLIDVLVTVHKFKIVQPGGSNSMSGTFGTGPGGSGAPGGSGIGVGNRPKIVRQSFSNQAVLDALVALTGQNFNFDKKAWRYWYGAQKKPTETLDARRD